MKRTIVSASVLALAFAGAQVATAAPAQYKVTGGGQIIVDTEEMPASGPGQTIAFTAQSAPTAADESAARGQFQYNSHTGVKFHGTVLCLVVEGNRATLAGEQRDGTPFQVDVVDNGQGAEAMDDLILLTEPDDVDCSQPEDPTMELGRGNVKVHKVKTAE